MCEPYASLHFEVIVSARSSDDGSKQFVITVSIPVWFLLYKFSCAEGHGEQSVDHCLEINHFIWPGVVRSFRNRSLCVGRFLINIKEDPLFSSNHFSI